MLGEFDVVGEVLGYILLVGILVLVVLEREPAGVSKQGFFRVVLVRGYLLCGCLETVRGHIVHLVPNVILILILINILLQDENSLLGSRYYGLVIALIDLYEGWLPVPDPLVHPPLSYLFHSLSLPIYQLLVESHLFQWVEIRVLVGFRLGFSCVEFGDQSLQGGLLCLLEDVADG